MKTPTRLLLILALAGCSSAPPVPENVVTRKNQAAEYMTFGGNYYAMSQYDQALNFFQLALELNVAVDNPPGIAQSYNALGKTYLALARIPQAEASFEEAYKIALELKDNPLIFQTANNKAEVLRRQNKLKEALDFLAPILSGSQGAPPPETGATLYHTQGIILRDLAKTLPGTNPEYKTDMNAAMASFQKALEINTTLNKKEEMASNYYQMATLHALTEDYALAMEDAAKALELDRSQENSLGIAQDYRLMGIIQQKSGNLEPSFEYHWKSYRIFTATSMKELQIKALEALIPLAETLKKTKELAVFQKEKAKLSGK